MINRSNFSLYASLRYASLHFVTLVRLFLFKTPANLFIDTILWAVFLLKLVQIIWRHHFLFKIYIPSGPFLQQINKLFIFDIKKYLFPLKSYGGPPQNDVIFFLPPLFLSFLLFFLYFSLRGGLESSPSARRGRAVALHFEFLVSFSRYCVFLSPFHVHGVFFY